MATARKAAISSQRCITYVTGAVLAIIPCCLTGCMFFPDAQQTSTTSTTTSSIPTSGVSCTSDLTVEDVQSMSRKGICVDDTSLFECPDQLVHSWPHTSEPVHYVRLFKASRPEDDEETAAAKREQFVAFAKANNVRVLVGSQITCEQEDDEKDWEQVKLLLQALGTEHVLGLSVGNELDQLADIGVESECLDKIWGGYLFEQTKSRIAWAREALGNPSLPVTSVFTGAIVWSGDLFDDSPTVKAQSYFRAMLDEGEKNYVFTFNFYPIFDPNNTPDPDGTCQTAMHLSSCYDDPACLSQKNMVMTRQKLDRFVQSNPTWGLQTARFWVGELGWSAPKPNTVPDTAPMAACDAFFSKHMFWQYYSEFLQWDMTLASEAPGPEYTFYFTMRDALNYGNQEHFGLMESCESSSCKLSKADVAASVSLV